MFVIILTELVLLCTNGVGCESREERTLMEVALSTISLNLTNKENTKKPYIIYITCYSVR
jgi:hypothetical protein